MERVHPNRAEMKCHSCTDFSRLKLIWLQNLTGLVGFGITLWAGGHPEFSPLPETPNEGVGLWLPLLTVRAGAGYRSNPEFAHDPVGTGFASTGVDYFLLRQPTDGQTVTFFFSAEDIRYFETLRPLTNEPGATKEQTFISDLRLGHALGGNTNWVVKFEGRHVYNDQFINTSSFDSTTTNLSSLHATAHVGTIIPSIAWSSDGPFRVELAAVGTRQLFLNADPETGLSSTWEFGPRLTLGWSSMRAGLVELELSGLHREFDDRVQNSALGLPLAESRLRQDDFRTELLWRREWDEARHWQTTLRTFYVRRRENGEGYTDFDRLGVGGNLRYQAAAWSMRLSARWSTYDYPRSYVVLGGVLAELRQRTTLQTEARLEYRFLTGYRAYVEYTWEREGGNRISDQYTAQVATFGLEHDF